MNAEEIRQRVKEILSKQNLGDALTTQEETILAFAYYAAGEQAVRMWAGSESEVGEYESSPAKPASHLLDYSSNRLWIVSSVLSRPKAASLVWIIACALLPLDSLSRGDLRGNASLRRHYMCSNRAATRVNLLKC